MQAEILQHNMESMFANRQLNITGQKRAKNAEKLSSGYKINRSADDAAGLAISEKMRWQIRGLNKASINIQDGISFIQTGEGALNEVHDMLHRMSELAIQAANDTNTASDRAHINQEIQQLKKETNRIFNTTEFNTKNIFRAPYIPDIEDEPNDYKLFNVGDGGSTRGGILVNGKRYTWEELGAHEDDKNDWNLLFTDDNGELIQLYLPAGDSLDKMRRVYTLDADDTGIKINNIYAGYWDSTIHQEGNEYSFEFHGMKLSFEADEGDTREDIIGHLQPDDMYQIRWDAIPSSKVSNSAVTSTSDRMTLNVTNNNKNDIESWKYSIIADDDGVTVQRTAGTGDDGITHVKKNWEDFKNTDTGEDDYPIVDWGTSSDNHVSNEGDSGNNPVTLDNDATYHYEDVRGSSKYPNTVEFNFAFPLDEAGKAEVIKGLTQELSGESVSAPISVIVSSGNSATVNSYTQPTFHFQRDQLLRNFGSDGSSLEMTANVTRTLVKDGEVSDYQYRRVLSEAYKSEKTTVTTVNNHVYGNSTRKITDNKGVEVTAGYKGLADISYDAIMSSAELAGISITTHANGELISQNTTSTSSHNYVLDTGQSPDADVGPNIQNRTAGSNMSESATFTINGVDYTVTDTYETSFYDEITTHKEFLTGVFYKNGDTYRQSSNNNLYELDNGNTSNEQRDTNGNRYKDASSGSSQKYAEAGWGYAENQVYDLCHYEYSVKNSANTEIMTGSSGQFIHTDYGHIRDSQLDAGNTTTLLPAETYTQRPYTLTSTGGRVYHDTDLTSRTIRYRGNDSDGVTHTIDVWFHDTQDRLTYSNDNTTLTFRPNGVASRSFNKSATSAGNATKSDLKVKMYPPEKMIHIQAGAKAWQDIPIKWTALSNSIIGIGGVKTLNYSQCQTAIDCINDATDYISSVRANFGAYQNRLEHAYDIDRNIEENTQASESRIRDTDIAEEMAAYSANGIIQQAGQAMLAQANQSKNGILNLLG